MALERAYGGSARLVVTIHIRWRSHIPDESVMVGGTVPVEVFVMKSILHCLSILFVLPMAMHGARACEGVQLDAGSFLVAGVGLDGQAARLALDPIGNVLLDSRFAEEAAFEVLEATQVGYEGSVRIGGAGAAEQEPRFAVGLELDAGEVRRPLPPVVVVDLRGPLGPAFSEIDGLLGTDLFGDHVLDIDAPDNCLRFLPRERFTPPGGGVEVQRERHRPVIEGRLEFPDGRQFDVRFLLDFGMSGGVRLSTRFVDAHQLDTTLHTQVPARMETGLGGRLESLETQAVRLVVGGAEWRELPVRLARETEGADADPPWDALLGIGLLKSRRMYYDSTGNRFWLVPDSK